MRLSLIYGVLAAAVGINARAVLNLDDGLDVATQCEGRKCSGVTIEQRWAPYRRAFIPDEGVVAGEGEASAEGEAGEASAAGKGTSGAASTSAGTGVDDGNSNVAASDAIWGAGSTVKTGGTGNSAGCDGTHPGMTDEEEISSLPAPPPATGAVYDTTQAWKHQVPPPQFQGLFVAAQDSFSKINKPDKAIYFSSGDKDRNTVAADNQQYGFKAAEFASKEDGVDSDGLLTFADYSDAFDSSAFPFNNDDEQDWFDIVSGAMASVSSGKVYAVLPAGGMKDPGVWGTSEFPQLQLNQAVKEMYWLDPDSMASTLIWSRTDGYTDPTVHPWPLNKPFTDTTVWPLRS